MTHRASASSRGVENDRAHREDWPIDQAHAVMDFEYPLNERIRSLLRLEDVFARILHFHRGDDGADHHSALLCMFELLDVASRADLKVDLVQELERQRQTLLSYRDNPDISEIALNGALSEIEQATAGVLAVSGRVGHYLRENDWLMSIRSRAAIPGGACPFDLPSYHYWQCGDADARRRDMDGWLRPLLPIRDGVAIVLRLLRGSAVPSPQRASAGSYQLTMADSARNWCGSAWPTKHRPYRKSAPTNTCSISASSNPTRRAGRRSARKTSTLNSLCVACRHECRSQSRPRRQVPDLQQAGRMAPGKRLPPVLLGTLPPDRHRRVGNRELSHSLGNAARQRQRNAVERLTGASSGAALGLSPAARECRRVRLC